MTAAELLNRLRDAENNMDRKRGAVMQGIRDWRRVVGIAYADSEELYAAAEAIVELGGNDYRDRVRELRGTAVLYQGIIDRTNL